MRRGILGSIAAVAAGAGSAWGQPPAPAGDPPAPAAVAPAGDVVPAQGPGGLPPGFAGFGRPAAPAPVIMPPLAVGPPGDPQGFGPAAGVGPPPGPQYPNPGPYTAPLYQPAPGGAPGGGSASGSAPHFWMTTEYLLLFSRSQPSRFPLLTTSAPNDNGLLGRASTLVLAGGEDLSYNPISGMRITAGFFGDANRRYGFEATGFVTEQRSDITDIVSSPSGIPTLARPFIDSQNPRGTTSLVVANTGFASGRVVVDTSSQVFSIEANGVVNLYRSEPGCRTSWSLDFLAGYRFFQLDEDLSINSATNLNIAATTTPTFAIGPGGIITQTGVSVTPGSVRAAGLVVATPGTITVTDDYRVVNRFNGGQVGLRGEVRHGMFTFGAIGKFAVGHMNQRLEINGLTTINDTTRAQTGSAFGGVFANASNIGRYNHDEISVIPEVNLNVGLNVSRGLTAFLGYNFLYATNVARPGSQINPTVNTATVPFSPNFGAGNRTGVPQTLFQQDEYYLMGVNFGMMLRY